ncbi:hypothetical protein BCR41DRAFT_373745 [Lobosporangium transversale]|uniref:Rho-GAP domain-containing protein n=1 Tax=Lobosporangium transversale TaxID=64571 RepID=A0A1Y2GD12_9FUNG|nr:hypothetical protein BCR41DRAFT_373745 [Lobosporangium transversale]ORZ07315.1 hypothetical protein BCR41DRAFT_373745 [Lobosporangium transversale]|eukprot:XP_021877978.1 hypothetical protein BCR41DRAFT_373745 [Lobosporangium transversale]
MAKVFTDDGDLTELSMEMTLVVVKRCVREIRERGLTTKGILRQVQMGYNQKVVMDTIRMILDDDASTELSPLHRVDIHLVAHAMKWAIRSSEETLVKYTDYQTLYLDQDRSFSCFVRGLPPTNRAILLDLFSLCADVTLLAHLNNMTLVTVAKAISLSIMAEPEQFSTFDASLQQRNLWGAACEDLLRAFLRIKTTHDLAKIEQEDDIDENRYVDNITRKVKSARQRNEVGPTTGSLNRSGSGVYDPAATPRSASPHSLAKSNSTRSGPITQLPFYDQEYEEIMQDQAHLSYLRRQSRNSQLLRPADRNRRRSSVGDVESLYMLPVDTSTDGYESEPEPSLEGLAPDFAGDLDWDFTKMDALHAEELPSSSPSQCTSIYRSNSISSIDSASTKVGQAPPSPMISGVPSKRSSNSASALQQGQTDASSSPFLSPLSSTQQSASAKVRIVLDHASPSMSPQRAKRSSLLRRSVSLDPHTMHGRVHKKPNELRQEILTRELAVQAERSQVAEDIRTQLLQVKNDEDQSIPSPTSSTFSFESASQDLERPAIPSRSASQGLGRSYSKTIAKSAKTNAKLGANDGLHSKKLSVGNTNELTSAPNSSNASIISQSSSSSDEYKPEVVSRPKDGEVSVHFTPIAPLPHKSKFQESLSEQPISPPPGYTQGLYQYKDTHKKSPSTKGGQSGTSSPIQSQPVSRSNSRSQPNQHSASTTPLQQVVGSSSASSHSSESKSKAAGFIRALSYKLRSKPSEEQLKSSKTNNQVVGGSPPPPPPPPPPSFSIQPPRLELSFLGNTGISNAGSSEDNLPPTSAPATMLHARSNSGSSTLGSWRRAAQDSLPVPATSTDHLGVGPPKGTSPGNVNTKQQRRRSKTVTASDERSPHRSASERTLSESSYTTDDSGSVKDSSKKDGLQSSTTDPKKAGEREYRFSTATLLKDASTAIKALEYRPECDGSKGTILDIKTFDDDPSHGEVSNYGCSLNNIDALAKAVALPTSFRLGPQ